MRRVRQLQTRLLTTLGIVVVSLTAPAAWAEIAPSVDASGNGEQLISPRFEAYIGSTHALTAAVQSSHSSTILSPLLTEWAANKQDDNEFIAQTTALLGRLSEWPETSLSLATYAPDRESRPRWRLYTDWPLDTCVQRLKALLADEAYEDYFAGIRLGQRDDGYVVRLKDETLAYLRANEGKTEITSHAQIPAADEPFRGISELEERPVLLACRRILTQTETDSGETFFSQFRFLTEFQYALAMAESGAWIEELSTSWPPISGTVAKAMLGRVRQTFFVPQESLLSAAFEITVLPATLDGMVGLGPQATMGSGGEMEIVGQHQSGVLAAHANAEMCVTLLAGKGFFPAPDIVLQTRLSDVELWRADMQAGIARLNHAFTKRDKDEPWHTEEVDGVTVYWRDSTPMVPGATMPFVYRSVLFNTKELDARDRERDFLVMGFTTTNPLKLVRRWNALPRQAEQKLHLPTSRRTNGQAWLNWRAIYAQLAPYFNLALSGISAKRMLPPVAEVAQQLPPGQATMKVSYTAATLSHSGPAPLGTLILPAMFMSAQAPGSTNSDLARERLAIERLKLLYHHSKLFRKDIGRWPARVSELDGYVDFAGHPQLLRLPRSSAQSWSEGFAGLFGGLFGSDDDGIIIADPVDEGLGATGRIDDSLYDIDWGREQWTLGYAEDTLEHLDHLYIDQDGRIHRRVKVVEEVETATASGVETTTEADQSSENIEANAKPASETQASAPAEAAVTSEAE